MSDTFSYIRAEHDKLIWQNNYFDSSQGDFSLAIVRQSCLSQSLGFCLRLQTKEEKNWDAKQRVYKPQALLVKGHS